MKKWTIFLISLAVVVVGGGWYAKHTVTHVVADQITRETSTTAGSQSVKSLLKSPQVQSAVSKYANHGPQFASQQQAIQFAASKLSPAEMLNLTKDYMHQNSLSEQQKGQVEQELLSKFTPQQLAAMAKVFQQ